MANKTGVILICLFLSVFTVSCDKKERPAAIDSAAQLNRLRFDVPVPFLSLNPSSLQPGGANLIFPLLYSFLCVPDTTGTLKPDLAANWSYDAREMTWTITLRKDARFHTQQPVTAADVAYSFQQGFAKLFPVLDESDKIDILSDHVLRIHLHHNEPAFMQKIWDMAVLPRPGRHAIDYYNAPVGSGPFKFKSREGQQSVALVANDDYYGGRPSLDGVIFYYQPDKEKTWTRLLSGATDIAQEISPKNYEIMQQYRKLFYFNQYTLNYYAILLYNTRIPLFSDPDVRRALTYAIDRQDIINKVLHGYGQVAIGPMGVDSPFHNPALAPLPYDPQKALTLLYQAGWSLNPGDHYLYKNNHCFEFTLLVFREYQIERQVAQYIRLCLNDIGIKMHIRLLPYEQLIARYSMNNDFEAVLTEFRGAALGPQYLAELWRPASNQQSYTGGFENPQVSRLFDKFLQETDPGRQKSDLYRIDTLIAALQPGTFLFQKTAINAMSRRFTLPFPFTLTYPGLYRLHFATLESR